MKLGLANWYRENQEDLRAVGNLAGSVAYIIGPALGSILAAEKIDWRVIGPAILYMLSTFRMWIKKSPIAKELGIQDTSGDLPVVTDRTPGP